MISKRDQDALGGTMTIEDDDWVSRCVILWPVRSSTPSHFNQFYLLEQYLACSFHLLHHSPSSPPPEVSLLLFTRFKPPGWPQPHILMAQFLLPTRSSLKSVTWPPHLELQPPVPLLVFPPPQHSLPLAVLYFGINLHLILFLFDVHCVILFMTSFTVITHA